MSKIKLSIITLMTCTSLAIAGGDIRPITTYEIMDEKEAEVTLVAPPAPIPAPIKVAVTPKATIPNADISPIYLGLGLVAARYDSRCLLNTTPGCDGVDKTGGVLLRAGYDFNKYMGLEARGMITSIKENGGKIQHVGAFVKPMYPLTDSLNTYGLIGVAKTTTSGTLRNTDVTGLAFGAGLEYDFSADKKKNAKYDREFDGKADQEKGFGVFADYERLYYKKNSPDLDALSVGLTYDF